jgi:cytochrome oxidase assembly protein ShyY1
MLVIIIIMIIVVALGVWLLCRATKQREEYNRVVMQNVKRK